MENQYDREVKHLNMYVYRTEVCVELSICLQIHIPTFGKLHLYMQVYCITICLAYTCNVSMLIYNNMKQDAQKFL